MLIKILKYVGNGWGVTSKFVKYADNDYRLTATMDANDWSVVANIPNTNDSFISDCFSVSNGETVSVNITIPCYSTDGSINFLSNNGTGIYVNLLDGDTGNVLARIKIWVDSQGYNHGDHSAMVGYGDHYPGADGKGDADNCIYWIKGDALQTSSFTFQFDKTNLLQADCAGHGMATLDNANGDLTSYLESVKNSIKHVKFQITGDNGWNAQATARINSINNHPIQAWAVTNDGDQGALIDYLAPTLITKTTLNTVPLNVDTTLPVVTHDLCSDVYDFIYIDGNYYNKGKTFKLTTAGTHIIDYYATDYKGNVSMKTFIVNKEEVPPTTKKVKVVLLGGQSNMEGWDGVYSDLDEQTIEKYLSGHDNVKINYHSHGDGSQNGNGVSFDDVIFGLGANNTLIGPEVGVAYQLGLNDPDSDYILIKSARGGTALDLDWSAEGNSYRTFIEDVNRVPIIRNNLFFNKKYLIKKVAYKNKRKIPFL